jgi:hypothetical protein
MGSNPVGRTGFFMLPSMHTHTTTSQPLGLLHPFLKKTSKSLKAYTTYLSGMVETAAAKLAATFAVKLDFNG